MAVVACSPAGATPPCNSLAQAAGQQGSLPQVREGQRRAQSQVITICGLEDTNEGGSARIAAAARRAGPSHEHRGCERGGVGLSRTQSLLKRWTSCMAGAPRWGLRRSPSSALDIPTLAGPPSSKIMPAAARRALSRSSIMATPRRHGHQADGLISGWLQRTRPAGQRSQLSHRGLAGLRRRACSQRVIMRVGACRPRRDCRRAWRRRSACRRARCGRGTRARCVPGVCGGVGDLIIEARGWTIAASCAAGVHRCTWRWRWAPCGSCGASRTAWPRRSSPSPPPWPSGASWCGLGAAAAGGCTASVASNKTPVRAQAATWKRCGLCLRAGPGGGGGGGGRAGGALVVGAQPRRRVPAGHAAPQHQPRRARGEGPAVFWGGEGGP